MGEQHKNLIGGEWVASKTTRDNTVKISAKVVWHARSVIFQIAELAVPRRTFQDILRLIARLRAPPALAWWGSDRKAGATTRRGMP